MPRHIQHIAVLRFSALGDVAMTVPVIRALAKQYPQLTITVVSRAFFNPLFDGIPQVDFFAADFNQRHKGLLGLYRLYTDLKALGVDAVADLHEVLRTRTLRTFFSLTGIKTVHIDKGRAAKKALTRSQNKIFKPLQTVTQKQVVAFEKLGFPLDLSQPEFAPKATLTQPMLDFTGQKEAQPWIGIAPFAQHTGKVYPPDLMREVIADLAASNYKLFLFGAIHEIPLLQALCAGVANVWIVPGKFTFAQELQLISNLDLMLSMDSGNAHLAAIFGVPTVTLWGATHPYAGFAPYAQPESNALVSDRDKYPLLPTSVYGNKQVAGYQDVMRTIAPKTVVEKIVSLLRP